MKDKNVYDFKLAYMQREQQKIGTAHGDLEFDIMAELIEAYLSGIVDVNIVDGEVFYRLVDADLGTPEEEFVPLHV